MPSTRVAAAAVVTTFALITSACTSATTTAEIVYRDAEQVSVKPQNLVRPTTLVSTTVRPTPLPATADSAGSGGGEQESTVATTTIPLNEDSIDPIDGVFTAMKIFNSCLSDKGIAFIGLPVSGGDPQDPVNDSQYIDNLIECAAVSQIQGAFQNLQTADENIPADEIEGRNRGLIEWADCLKGRGWKLGELKPDSRGLLQIPQDLTPEDGQTILESNDMQECRDIAVARVEAETP